MFIAKWLYLGPILVLTFGLLSCKPAERGEAPAPFLVPEPEWVHASGSVKFTAATVEGTRSVADVLSFADAPSGTLSVRTRCVGEIHSWSAVTLHKLPGRIALFAMLPPEVLAPDEKSKTRCGFEFQATGPNGSSHRFRMPEMKIDLELATPTIMWRENKSEFKESEFAQSRLFATANENLDPLIQCRDFSVRYRFASRSEFLLDDFDWPAVENLRHNPLQTCRVLGLRKGVVQALSRPFNLRLDPALPRITYSKPLRTHGKLPSPGVSLFTAQFENSHPFAIHFRLLKPKPQSYTVRTFFVEEKGPFAGGARCLLPLRKYSSSLAYKLASNTAAKIKQEQDSLEISMEPKGRADVDLILTSADALWVFDYTTTRAYILDDKLELQAQQIGESAKREEVATAAWGFNELMWHSLTPLAPDPKRPFNHDCF